MKQQFLRINLQDSLQEVSCVTLENMVDMLRDPDFRQECELCKQDNKLIQKFPLVGFGITIKRIKKGSSTKIKVTQFSKIEKIIDTTFFYQNYFLTKKDYPNCVLPLLSSKEGNDQLLNCELFKRKISYLVHQQFDCYQEDTYLELIQASIYHIIKKNGNQTWGKKILMLSFETCKQVFINTPLFYNSLQSLEQKKSKFQLLNLICLFYMGQTKTEQIFDYYIRPNFSKNYQKPNEEFIQPFFNTLKFENFDLIYQNIQQFINNYLVENNYFILNFNFNQFLLRLIEFMIPKDEQWVNIQRLECIKNQESDIREYKYYTISSIYQNLLTNLFEDYNEEKKCKYFESFSKHFEEDEYSYQLFLIYHDIYHEIYEIYGLYKKSQNQFQIDSIFVERYQAITIRFIVKKISIDSIKRKNPTSILDLSSYEEFNKTLTYLDVFKKIYNLQESQAEELHSSIIEEIKNLTWLNLLSSLTNFKEQDQIILFLQKFLSHLKTWASIQNQEECAGNLNDISRFSFLLIQRTRMLRIVWLINQQGLQDLLRQTNKQNEFFCRRIFELSKTL
ncbi:unnamed protein product (macronuclear) [Paramecium tetraurelia]|uniref:Uncharacterized protein n=1 Tax=Paramecium tetraurelia TaxID=5888 RepID=A0E5U4_PARTE|nr:uncharacterized protein GSPATT00003523001 [Paramecium tetraurelia]CAK90661.1 unnamed protein product [Paramecium tetraurelia]|eukprot:XP_001458058.1 hypothetical protein (macronuclear) [Paramecium tetraurelia strain d4-2]